MKRLLQNSVIGRSLPRSRLLRSFAALLLVAVALRVLPHQPLRERFPSSLAFYDAHGHLLRLTTAGDETYRLWTPLDRISPALVEATLLYEDRYFRRHFAVNPWALLRGAGSLVAGPRRLGASTLPMQLARRIYELRTRTPLGKIAQILGAVWLELRCSKDELLEAYLNLVPYGRNIEGAGAASRIYFGKPPSSLSPAEALTLAVIPQSPTRRAPARDGSLPAALTAARDSLVLRYAALHPSPARPSSSLGHAATTDPPSVHDTKPGAPSTASSEIPGDNLALYAAPAVRPPERLPFLAPHLCDALVAEAGGHRDRGDPAEVTTTLDLHLQRLVERQTRAYVDQRRAVGIRNAAVMLVDARTMEVKATLGSADFGSAAIDGQVDGTRARRSPGSALKPFVYALGLEQGILHPRTLLKDTPASFGAWSPENFDGKYLGPIRAEDALVRSRNLPALAVAAKLNKPSFYEFLETAGVGHLQPEAHYGLSLVLGGAEVTMEELAELYAVLPSRGYLRPLRYRQDDPPVEGTRVLSPEASWVTMEMLRQNPRPNGSLALGGEREAQRPAWKTGTSWGFRDAWSAGVVGPYVLVVWVGEFDGRSNPAFVGGRAAAPLFFSIADALAVEESKSFPDPAAARPAGVSRVEVCAVSGQLPSASCPHRAHTWFLPGRSPIELCTLHRPVLVDDQSGLQTCSPYGDGHSHSEVYEYWPSDLARLYAQAGLPRRAAPDIDPRCAIAPEAQREKRPQITSPLQGVTYTVQPSRPTDAIAFQAVTDGAHEVYWFVDHDFVGRARAGVPFLWTPHPGRYTVRVVDDLGLADSRPLQIEVAN